MNVKFPLWWCRDHGKLFWFTADVLLGVVVHYWCKSSVNKKVERIIFLFVRLVVVVLKNLYAAFALAHLLTICVPKSNLFL